MDKKKKNQEEIPILIAQRHVAAFSVNLTSLTQPTVKTLASYLTDIPDSVFVNM